VYDWTVAVGFISSDFEVFDGADDRQNCTKIDHNQWTYNNALFTYGAASMFAATNDGKWKDRTNGFVKSASRFFTANENSTDVMSEIVCEPFNKCNNDQASFKAYLGRWLAKTSVLAPYTADTINSYLQASAKAAAESCSGGSGSDCGMKWYVGGFDGNTGVGQQLSAMEVIQALLVSKAGLPGKAGDSKNSTQGTTTTSNTALSSTVSTAATSQIQFTLDTTSIVASTTSPTTVLSSLTDVPTASSVAAVSSAGQVTAPSPSYGQFGEKSKSVESSSFCTAHIVTITSTIEESTPTPTPTESACTPNIVTVTVTAPEGSSPAPPPPSPPTSSSPASVPVKQSSVVTIIVSNPSSVPAAPSSPVSVSVPNPAPAPVTSTGAVAASSSPTTLIVDTGKPTISFTPGFLTASTPATPTQSTPAVFTGAANSNHATLGLIGIVIGAVALI
jgi:mannan endo-1,6-alpha-mannosidase